MGKKANKKASEKKQKVIRTGKLIRQLKREVGRSNKVVAKALAEVENGIKQELVIEEDESGVVDQARCPACNEPGLVSIDLGARVVTLCHKCGFRKSRTAK